MSTPAGDDEYGRATIRIVLDDDGVDDDARALGVRISRTLDRATRTIGTQIHRNIQRGLRVAGAVSVQVVPDLSRFNAQLSVGLGRFDSLNVQVAPDLTGFVERVRAALAGEEVRVRVVPDLDGLVARVRAVRLPDLTANVNADTDRFTRALAGLGAIASRVGSALGSLLRFGALGIAAAGAAVAVSGLASALAPVAGLLAALPAVTLGWQAALGSLRLALMGVGDAFKAALTGTADQFAAALEKLSPAAQAAAREVRGLRPAFEGLRNTVQNAFFSQFEGQITAVAERLGGPLRKGLAGIAGEFGKAASEGLKFAGSAQAAAPIAQILEGTRKAVSGLGTAIAPLAKGFLDAGAAISKAFGAQIGKRIGQMARRSGRICPRRRQAAKSWRRSALRWLYCGSWGGSRPTSRKPCRGCSMLRRLRARDSSRVWRPSPPTSAAS